MASMTPQFMGRGGGITDEDRVKAKARTAQRILASQRQITGIDPITGQSMGAPTPPPQISPAAVAASVDPGSTTNVALSQNSAKAVAGDPDIEQRRIQVEGQKADNAALRGGTDEMVGRIDAVNRLGVNQDPGARRTPGLVKDTFGQIHQFDDARAKQALGDLTQAGLVDQGRAVSTGLETKRGSIQGEIGRTLGELEKRLASGNATPAQTAAAVNNLKRQAAARGETLEGHEETLAALSSGRTMEGKRRDEFEDKALHAKTEAELKARLADIASTDKRHGITEENKLKIAQMNLAMKVLQAKNPNIDADTVKVMGDIVGALSADDANDDVVKALLPAAAQIMKMISAQTAAKGLGVTTPQLLAGEDGGGGGGGGAGQPAPAAPRPQSAPGIPQTSTSTSGGGAPASPTSAPPAPQDSVSGMVSNLEAEIAALEIQPARGKRAIQNKRRKLRELKKNLEAFKRVTG